MIRKTDKEVEDLITINFSKYFKSIRDETKS